MQAAIDEAKQGLAEGGIPIGSVIVHHGKIIGRGHNMRVQLDDPLLHGEMSAFKDAGRQSAGVYRECVLYTTLSLSDVQRNFAPLQNSENHHRGKYHLPGRRGLVARQGRGINRPA